MIFPNALSKYTGTYDGALDPITITEYSLNAFGNIIILDNNVFFNMGDTNDLNLGIINASSTIKLYLSETL
jgi:hypothetical protein